LGAAEVTGAAVDVDGALVEDEAGAIGVLLHAASNMTAQIKSPWAFVMFIYKLSQFIDQ
jgi:hypothetical protein